MPFGLGSVNSAAAQTSTGSTTSGQVTQDGSTNSLEGDNSLRVCKLIVDSEGSLFAGEYTESEFNIDINASSSENDFSTTTTFTTPINLNSDLFSADDTEASVNDVQCKLIEDLPNGSYTYSSEQIDQDDQWGDALYNDGVDGVPENLDDFYPYSGELFNDEPSDDGERNTTSDGDIRVSDGETRTLVIKNTFSDVAPKEPEPATIEVCKVLRNQSGEIISGSDLSANFGFRIEDRNDASSFSTTTSFDTGLDYNSNLFNENQTDDAECVDVSVPAGDYRYFEEEIVSDDSFANPIYHDGFEKNADSLDDLAVYSGELWDDNPDNNGSRNKTADGDIDSLDEEDNRRLVIANTLSDDTDDASDDGSDSNENEESSGGGGGGVLTPSGGSDDGGNDGGDEDDEEEGGGEVLGEQDEGTGSGDDPELDPLLGDLADALRGLRDSLGSDGSVAGDQDSVGWPNTGDGSLPPTHHMLPSK